MDKQPSSEDQPSPPERGAANGDQDSGGAPGAGSHAGFREPLGENALEQLRRYQVITIPPDARAALLHAKLPGASPELLYDTLPPNRGTEHAGGALELPVTEPELEPESAQHGAVREGREAEDDAELAATEVTGAPDRHLRGIAIAGGSLLVVALLLGWVTLSRDREIQRTLGRQSLPTARAPRDEVRAAPAQLPAALTRRTEAPTATAAAASAKARPVAAPPSVTEKNPATLPHEAPNSKLPVAVPVMPSSEPAAAPTHPPAASSAAPPSKKFRLGSR